VSPSLPWCLPSGRMTAIKIPFPRLTIRPTALGWSERPCLPSDGQYDDHQRPSDPRAIFSSGLFLFSILESETRSPAASIPRSTAVPSPNTGGTERWPVMWDAIPVTTSAKTNGMDVKAKAFKTALPSPPIFHGLLFEDQAPVTASRAAKIPATIGL
jgi:hypothetical protein